MARIKLLSQKQPVADFSVQGAVVTIRGLAIDCAAYYASNTRSVEVRSNESGETVIGGNGLYLAVIEIPGQRFEESENGQVLLPMDPNAILIQLWPAA